jgi:hypothetical protein
MRIPNRAAALLSFAAVLGLSACNRTPEQPSTVVEDNVMTEVPVDDATALNSTDAPPPANVSLNVTNTVAPPPAFTDTEQMRDDADATGLTSRLPNDDAANEAQPAQ